MNSPRVAGAAWLTSVPSRWRIAPLLMPFGGILKMPGLVAASGTDHEVQAAVDGMVEAELTARLAALGWPRPAEAYLYKQLFVLRNSGE